MGAMIRKVTERATEDPNQIFEYLSTTDVWYLSRFEAEIKRYLESPTNVDFSQPGTRIRDGFQRICEEIEGSSFPEDRMVQDEFEKFAVDRGFVWWDDDPRRFAPDPHGTT